MSGISTEIQPNSNTMSYQWVLQMLSFCVSEGAGAAQSKAIVAVGDNPSRKCHLHNACT